MKCNVHVIVQLLAEFTLAIATRSAETMLFFIASNKHWGHCHKWI